jgi:uncharacterized protein
MKIKAIFHIDEYEKWDLLLTNVENLLKGTDINEAEIEVVANSKAVAYYKADSSSNELRLEELSKRGIVFAACRNSLNSLKLDQDMLYPYIRIVPIGVKEIIEKEHEGFAYIKP